MKLYELTDEIRLLEQIDEPEELQKAAEALSGQFNEKAVNVAKFIMELVADNIAIETEINRLLDKRKSVNNKIFNLKEYLKNNMVKARIDKIDGIVVKLSIRGNPPSCEVQDVMALPSEYRKLIPEKYEPDRLLIMKHFKDTGEIIEGAVIVTDNKRLEIK